MAAERRQLRAFRPFEAAFRHACPPADRLAGLSRCFWPAQPGLGLILQSSRATPIPP